MHADHRVVVDVHHPRGRVDLVGHLVHVALRGQARTNVDQLAQTRIGDQVPDGAAQERPVGAGSRGRIGRNL